MSRGTVLIGSGIASVRVAQALRRAGYDGRLQMLGDEPELPDDKPPLSKGLLAGPTPAERIRLLTAAQASELGIELRLGAGATRLDIAERQVELADGSAVAFDDVAIATGARAPARTVGAGPGTGATSGVHLLRSFADRLALRADLRADLRAGDRWR